MKVAILTSENQWFVPHAKVLQQQIENSSLFFNHKEINDDYETIFILAYHEIIPLKYLKKHKHNLVIHESALPQGKGWAPLFWQVLENKNEIPFTMIEASDHVDSGDIYMQKKLLLNGSELNEELRKKQADLSIQMCLEFLNHYDKYQTPKQQQGKESFYPKRLAQDSQLDLSKSINEQFNLLRTVNNEDYPAFFIKDNQKYKITIEKMES